jgi:hypothetical protein
LFDKSTSWFLFGRLLFTVKKAPSCQPLQGKFSFHPKTSNSSFSKTDISRTSEVIDIICLCEVQFLVQMELIEFEFSEVLLPTRITCVKMLLS